jgi:LAS superfamily LD-carboxypeptidase LdcB
MRLLAGLCLIAPVAWAQPTLTKAELMGRVTPSRDPAFAAVEDSYLRKPVAEAYTKMKEAAARDGVTLRLISATRTFADQRRIWERKWTSIDALPADRALKIMTYSSMPGTSRHHWGTDLDLNSLSPKWFVDTAEGRKGYGWLQTHAKEYGFCQPYTTKGPARPTGYAEEKWHWSYQPLSSAFLKQYLATVTAADITGFSGSGTAAAVRSIEDFVGGVDASCR